jgi:acetoin utilization deacetylase AcuC-like enzyme
MSAYNLFDNLKIVNPLKADEKILKTFHSQEYVNHLKKCTNEEDEEKIFNDTDDDFGIGYDCEIIENLFEFCQVVAGASITAAHLINIESANYCGINLFFIFFISSVLILKSFKFIKLTGLVDGTMQNERKQAGFAI